LHHPIDPDAILMVMFTSGSTARPKGLAMGVAYAGRSLKEFVDKFHINSNDVVAGLASLTQGGANGLIALTTGAKLRIIDMGRVGVMETLRVMHEEGVTVLSFVPSVLRTFMELPGGERAFSSLRVLDLHGERILASDIRLFRERLPAHCKISITYGATETGAVTSWFVDDRKIDGAVAPIGYVVPGKRIAIIGDDGDPVAEGEIGEIVVRGEMATGSWQAGGKTSARFAVDPDDPTKMIYPMGDQVRMRADGLLEFIGRADRQVKIRGLWADPGEVEAALRAAGGVVDAVVIARTRSGQADSLAAFITLEDDNSPPSIPALRRAVAKATAEHMVPSIIRILPSIPRLPNFKPDLVRLAELLA
jgi:acyl-coenzyme A synthetase/AMP-(fatty) acid ligase